MEPVIGVALLWLLFGGTHIGLATRRVRTALVDRFGPWGQIGAFSLVASVTYAALVAYYAAHRFAGPAALAAGQHPVARTALIACVVVGFTLALASLWTYPASPYALGNARTREPRGLERITRHPFFAGVALASGAHALLATRLVGTVFFGGLVLLSALGAAHQDRKLRALRGAPYEHYMSVTSFMPFAAVLAGRQRIAWGELRWTPVLVSLLAVYALRVVHASIFAHGGLWVILTAVGGAAVLGLQSWRKTVRPRRAVPAGTPSPT
jgi:uncharacterized membrane protein